MNILIIIILFAIAQSVFMGIAMITMNRGNKRANRIWGILLILYGYSILPLVMISSNLYVYCPYIYLTGHPLLFLFGPLTMLYTLYLAFPDFNLKIKHSLHALPFIIYIALLTPIYSLSASEKIAMINAKDDGGMMVEIIIFLLIILHIYTYLFFTDRILKRYDARIKNSFSSLDRINLSWLRSSVYGMGIVFGIMMVLIIFAINSSASISESPYHLLIPLTVAAVLFYDTFKALRQPELYMGINVSENLKRYEKSSLTEDKAQQYKSKLLEFMQLEKPYKESNLTIKDLATKVNIPGYYISQVINDKLNQNFFDFVNRYRIEETKAMFNDTNYANYSLLAIAYEVGFNSKSVFNSSFKKYTGMTPSIYRKKLAEGKIDFRHAS